jgi:WhiB family redox-sensing transcriptional regulator
MRHHEIGDDRTRVDAGAQLAGGKAQATEIMTATWRDAAACLRTDPDLFFPISTTGHARDQIAEAKRICQACPVRSRCLDWALAAGNVSGIWGGFTDDERRTLRNVQICAGPGESGATAVRLWGYGDCVV